MEDSWKITANGSWVLVGHVFLGCLTLFVPWTTRRNWVFLNVSWHWQIFHNFSGQCPKLTELYLSLSGRKNTEMGEELRNVFRPGFLENLTFWTRLGNWFVASIAGNFHVCEAFTIVCKITSEMLIHRLTNRWLKGCAQLTVQNRSNSRLTEFTFLVRIMVCFKKKCV